MARRPEPRWYESRQGWYCWLHGKLHMLAKGKDGKKEAYEKFHRLMLGEPSHEAPVVSLPVLLDEFLEWSSQNREPQTFEFYKRHLASVSRKFGAIKAKDLSIHAVERWISNKKWSQNTRTGLITSLKRAYNWGVKRGLIAVNPVQHLEFCKVRIVPGVRSHDQGVAPFV